MNSDIWPKVHLKIAFVLDSNLEIVSEFRRNTVELQRMYVGTKLPGAGIDKSLA